MSEITSNLLFRISCEVFVYYGKLKLILETKYLSGITLQWFPKQHKTQSSFPRAIIALRYLLWNNRDKI